MAAADPTFSINTLAAYLPIERSDHATHITSFYLHKLIESEPCYSERLQAFSTRTKQSLVRAVLSIENKTVEEILETLNKHITWLNDLFSISTIDAKILGVEQDQLDQFARALRAIKGGTISTRTSDVLVNGMQAIKKAASTYARYATRDEDGTIDFCWLLALIQWEFEGKMSGTNKTKARLYELYERQQAREEDEYANAENASTQRQERRIYARTVYTDQVEERRDLRQESIYEGVGTEERKGGQRQQRRGSTRRQGGALRRGDYSDIIEKMTEDELITVYIRASSLTPSAFLKLAEKTWGWQGKQLDAARRVVRVLNKGACGGSHHRIKSKIKAILTRLGLLAALIAVAMPRTSSEDGNQHAPRQISAAGCTRFDL